MKHLIVDKGTDIDVRDDDGVSEEFIQCTTSAWFLHLPSRQYYMGEGVGESPVNMLCHKAILGVSVYISHVNTVTKACLSTVVLPYHCWFPTSHCPDGDIEITLEMHILIVINSWLSLRLFKIKKTYC